MAKAVRLIGPDDGLQFELDLREDQQPRGLAWGYGRLRLQGELIWYREDKLGSEAALHWTWIDLLEFLAANWSALLLEETYPIPVLPLYPGLLRREAERRWEDQLDEIIDTEDEAIYRFICRHDLSMALKGLFVPSLILLRQGQRFAVSCAASNRNLMLPFDHVVATLTELGEELAAAVRSSMEPRSQHALARWDSRQERLRAEVATLHSGLPPAATQRLVGDRAASAFWEIDESDPTADTVILATARMSAGHVDIDTQHELIERLRALPKHDTSELDALAARADAELEEAGRPFEQGYQLAAWLRNALGLEPEDLCEPEALLHAWGVTIEPIDLPDSPIEAVAAWGNGHGPAILLNRSTNAAPSLSHRERATLAHEVCHLLIDRHRALPVAEVLGGRTPEYAEKRARAFAAELLLPRETAAAKIREIASLSVAIEQLQQDYQVSKALLGWQISNSGVIRQLTADERSQIARMTLLAS